MPHDCVKRRIQTESSVCVSRPRTQTLIRSGQEAKKRGLKLIRTTLWQNHRPHQIFCATEPANTPVFIHAERKRGIMSRRDGIVKKRLGRFSQGVKLMSGCAIPAAPSTPSHRF